MPPPLPPPLSFCPTRGQVLVLPWRVLDGDTVEVAFLVRETIRLHGINAPEKSGATKAAARAAAVRLRELLGTGPMTLELHGREKFGRLLGTFYGASDVPINQQLVAEGLVKPWDGHGARP